MPHEAKFYITGEQTTQPCDGTNGGVGKRMGASEYITFYPECEVGSEDCEPLLECRRCGLHHVCVEHDEEPAVTMQAVSQYIERTQKAAL